MRDERSLYFSPAEFMVLLELAGGPACSLLSDGAVPEDAALTAAFAAVFRRGLIQREGDGFVLSPSGKMFDEIRNAPWAVYISGGSGGETLCYWAEHFVCLVELADVIVTTQYRLRRLDRAELGQWLFDSGLLEPPVLTAEDVRELEFLPENGQDSAVIQPLLQLEKHVNGGPAVEVCQVYKRRGHMRISRSGRKQDAYYTQESLSDMLAECFGKEEHDRC